VSLVEEFARNVLLATAVGAAALVGAGLALKAIDVGLRELERGRTTRAASILATVIVLGAALIMTAGGA
jgi:hypothetical protein